MLRLLGGLMDRVCAAAGALLFSQAPLFMQQYTQQLVGREAELRLQMNGMQQTAAISGKTLEQLIQKFIDSPDSDFHRQGEMMQSLVSRWHHLSDALLAMQTSSTWTRPFEFFYYLDLDVARSTVKSFAFGLSFSSEGMTYALIGLMAGYLAFSVLRKLWQISARRLFRYNP